MIEKLTEYHNKKTEMISLSLTHTRVHTHTHTLDYNRKNFNSDLAVRLMFCKPQQTFTRSNQESDGKCMYHVWETGLMCTVFWLGDQRE
jgi:hypothetical protein